MTPSTSSSIRFTVCILLVTQCLAQLPHARGENWPGWRGPLGDGTSHETTLPIKWSDSENVEWKVPVVGEGHASPVVWQDHIFVVTCLPESEERALLAIDGKTGKTRWQKTVIKTPLETKHKLNSYAPVLPQPMVNWFM